jgi:hypothetical protein
MGDAHREVEGFSSLRHLWWVAPPADEADIRVGDPDDGDVGTCGTAKARENYLEALANDWSTPLDAVGNLRARTTSGEVVDAERDHDSSNVSRVVTHRANSSVELG